MASPASLVLLPAVLVCLRASEANPAPAAFRSHSQLAWPMLNRNTVYRRDLLERLQAVCSDFRADPPAGIISPWSVSVRPAWSSNRLRNRVRDELDVPSNFTSQVRHASGIGQSVSGNLFHLQDGGPARRQQFQVIAANSIIKQARCFSLKVWCACPPVLIGYCQRCVFWRSAPAS
jgi:hypothetical protein